MTTVGSSKRSLMKSFLTGKAICDAPTAPLVGGNAEALAFAHTTEFLIITGLGQCDVRVDSLWIPYHVFIPSILNMMLRFI